MKLKFTKCQLGLWPIIGILMVSCASCSRPKPPAASIPLTDESVSPPPQPAVQLGEAPRRVEGR
jgi:hypothetical protein